MAGRAVKNAVFQAVAGTDRKVREAIRKSSKAAADIIALQLTEVVKDWDDKPKFKVVAAARMDGVGFKVVLGGSRDAQNHFVWTDLGTKPHKIRAKNGGSLAFQVGYQAKTTPVAQFGVGDGTANGAWVRTQEVDHPGTDARKFSKTFVDEVIPLFKADISKNLKDISRRKG